MKDIQFDDAQGKTKSLKDFDAKLTLVVNVASKCGFTPQYKGLQELYDNYHAKGLEIIGFPCNQFGAQEPGSNEEIQSFCSLNYGVSFPVMGKIDVNGKNEHPLYKELKSKAPGILGSKAIKWNFTKFLIDSSGNVERFSPQTSPEKMESQIQEMLK